MLFVSFEYFINYYKNIYINNNKSSELRAAQPENARDEERAANHNIKYLYTGQSFCKFC